jgi:hypothetical protein
MQPPPLCPLLWLRSSQVVRQQPVPPLRLASLQLARLKKEATPGETPPPPGDSVSSVTALNSTLKPLAADINALMAVKKSLAPFGVEPLRSKTLPPLLFSHFQALPLSTGPPPLGQRLSKVPAPSPPNELRALASEDTPQGGPNVPWAYAG